jgi:Zn-dependent peptidase ImmA (M78 family)
MGRRARKTYAERTAQDLLDQLGISTAPVRPEAIAHSLGAGYHLRRMENESSGLLVVNEKGANIAVNSTHASVRQRFTGAHELGHLQMHAKNGGVFVDAKGLRRGRGEQQTFGRGPLASQGTDADEIEANAFASALLMPAKLVKERWSEATGGSFYDDSDIADMASHFEVSQTAMTFRLQALRLI